MNNIPDWWEFTIIALAIFRIFRILSEDSIFDRPRAWVLRLGDWEEGKALPKAYRAKWGEFLTCPWCLGFHLSVILWLLWLWEPDWTVVGLTPFALSAVVGLIAHFSND